MWNWNPDILIVTKIEPLLKYIRNKFKIYFEPKFQLKYKEHFYSLDLGLIIITIGNTLWQEEMNLATYNEVTNQSAEYWGAIKQEKFKGDKNILSERA